MVRVGVFTPILGLVGLATGVIYELVSPSGFECFSNFAFETPEKWAAKFSAMMMCWVVVVITTSFGTAIGGVIDNLMGGGR